MEATLELLLRLDVDLKPWLSEQALCSVALQAMMKALSADSGSLMLEKDGAFSIVASVGLPLTLCAQRVALTDGPAGRVFRSRQSLRIDGPLDGASHGNFHGPVSAVLAPLLLADRVVGVMCLNSKRESRRFAECDQQLVALAANRVAGALDNSRRLRDERGSYLKTVKALVAAVEAKDPHTAGHCERVARLSVMIAHALGRPDAEIESLRLAALLHDVGKIGVPETILTWPGQLSDHDRRIVQTHTELGYSICRSAGLPDELCLAVRHHHERYDGGGYPQRLASRAIPLDARIIAVADAYDDMITTRAHRPALNPVEAIAELVRVSGSQLDPSVSGALISALGHPRAPARSRPTGSREALSLVSASAA